MAAASDLTTLQTPLAELTKAKIHVHVRFTFASSGTLARQIENGAPFDVFLSANRLFVNELAASGRLDPATVRVYAVGRLGLWSGDGQMHDLAALTSGKVQRIAIANPTLAPYGLAAKQLLERHGLWKRVQPKLVYGENVRQALQFAESGNADVVMTSWSLLYDKAGAVLLPQDHDPVEQAGGVVSSSKNASAGREFLELLSGADGRKLLKSHGLTPPRRPTK